MTTPVPQRRLADKWRLPSTVAGLMLVVAAVLMMVFNWSGETVALSVGILGGVLIQGDSVIALASSLRGTP